jgi:hypothetical protein
MIVEGLRQMGRVARGKGRVWVGWTVLGLVVASRGEHEGVGAQSGMSGGHASKSKISVGQSVLAIIALVSTDINSF